MKQTRFSLFILRFWRSVKQILKSNIFRFFFLFVLIGMGLYKLLSYQFYVPSAKFRIMGTCKPIFRPSYRSSPKFGRGLRDVQIWNLISTKVLSRGAEVYLQNASENLLLTPNAYFNEVYLRCKSEMDLSIYFKDEVLVSITPANNKEHEVFKTLEAGFANNCFEKTDYSFALSFDSAIASNKTTLWAIEDHGDLEFDEIMSTHNEVRPLARNKVSHVYTTKFNHDSGKYLTSKVPNAFYASGFSTPAKYYPVDFLEFPNNCFLNPFPVSKVVLSFDSNLAIQSARGYWLPYLIVKCPGDSVRTLEVEISEIEMNEFEGFIQLAGKERTEFFSASVSIPKMQDGSIEINFADNKLQVKVEGVSDEVLVDGVNVINSWGSIFSNQSPISLALISVLLSLIFMGMWQKITAWFKNSATE